ncbi:hypothetical protein DK419_22440 [Methylobacterium terrae]|uniref:Uncharacterized protein n=1 Tax=Methylobacterium terrae TaxID=2202827 RepID=A0A2U8WRN3_9HYPH|nr:hypothetical protein [Methylobacterium terrae]AWN48767.1 hypothetical protein DK419_22440 [Methylobacterium terrae]
MAEIKIVAGSCGKGRGQYEAGVFTTPDGIERGVDAVVTIESHGGVAGERGWGEQVLTGIKGGLGLASTLDLTGAAGLAASALAAVEADENQPKALVEIAFVDGGFIVALADARLTALVMHDREVLRVGFARAANRVAALPTPDASAGRALQAAGDVVQAAAEAAGNSLNSALGFVRRSVRLERG